MAAGALQQLAFSWKFDNLPYSMNAFDHSALLVGKVAPDTTACCSFNIARLHLSNLHAAAAGFPLWWSFTCPSEMVDILTLGSSSTT